MKNFFRIPLFLMSLTLLFSSCSSDNLEDGYDFNSQEEEISNKNIWPVVVAIVKIVSDVSDGRYVHRTIYDPATGNKVSETRACEGSFGTCTITSKTSSTNESISSKRIEIDESDSPMYSINAELINTEEGVFYAINYKNHPEDSRQFFKSSTMEITSPIKIDNPNVLEDLKIDRAITIEGNYEVHSANDYKYIIIQ